MLYLNPPYYIIRGVALLPDHADREQWYYEPLSPRLVTTQEGGGPPVPRLSLIKYRGAAGQGGLLDFDVHLGLEPDELEEIRAELRDQAGLRDLPRLAPIPLVDGSVELMMLGHRSGAPAGEDGEGEGGGAPRVFEIKIHHAAKPALYGDNRAAFSVELDAEAVTVLERALQGEMAPIGVVYSLEYLALRPAYAVRVRADWERVQKHFEESFGVDTPIFAAQIDEVIDELIEDRTIDIQVDTFVPEGEDTASVIASRDQAVRQVRDMVTDAFFQPSLDPINEDPDDWDRATSTFREIAFPRPNAAFTYRKLDITRIDEKRLDVNFRERITVRRRIYPQGHLSGLFRALRGEGVELDRFVIPVELDDPWFERRRVRVIARADFEADGIASIAVRLRYGDEVRTVLLEGPRDEEQVEWVSQLEGGAVRRQVTASYRVTFRDDAGGGRPLALSSPEVVIDTDQLEIFPRELYTLSHVPIAAIGLDWERYPRVEVAVRYEDPEHGIELKEDFVLTRERPEAIWRMFQLDPRRDAFDYKLTFIAADHRDIEIPWTTAEDQRVGIRDPQPRNRALEVQPAVDWGDVLRVFVDLRYDDPENGLREERSFTFDEQRDAPRTFAVHLADPERREIHYKVTFLHRDGRVVEIPGSETREPRIFVFPSMKGHRVVRIYPEHVDFAARRVRQIEVELRYEDEAGGLSFAEALTFAGPGAEAFFEYDFADEERTDFDYRVKTLFTNGLSRATGWRSSGDEELVLPVG